MNENENVERGTDANGYTYEYPFKRHGIAKLFYPSGKLKSTTTYESGVVSGEYKEYYESGNMHINANYKDGVLHGPFKYLEDVGDKVRLLLGYDTEYKNGVKGKVYYLFNTNP